MTERRKFGVMAGALVVALGGQFVGCPVFAEENPVKVEIVEMVDDGGGGLKPWQDIVGAMPGASYSAIPRVKNSGEVPASVRICLSESATDASGETIVLPANTFGIRINEGWTLDSESSVDASDPAAGNCYAYGSAVEVGEATEPLFYEIALSSELGNEFENSTFNLHLEADAVGEDDLVVPNTGGDTGIRSFVINSGLIFLTAGILALIVRAVYSVRKK